VVAQILELFTFFSTLSTTRYRLLIVVRDNNVEQALKVLKKKLQREGIFRDLKLKDAYEKPSIKKAREHAESIRRARKLQRKKLQREGLLPMPKKIEKPRRPGQAAERGGY
jgi:small subunit ribosomal protein S21